MAGLVLASGMVVGAHLDEQGDRVEGLPTGQQPASPGPERRTGPRLLSGRSVQDYAGDRAAQDE